MSLFVNNEMHVTKRDGELETVQFDKILNRLKLAGKETNIQINYTALVIKVIDQLYDTIPATKIDELMAEQCASMASIHPDYGVLAGRVIISNHQKNTGSSFVNAVKELYNNTDKRENHSPIVSQEFYNIVIQNEPIWDTMCVHSRDFLIDYFGFKTLERSYLLKKNGKIMERIQYMWLRVAISIHGNDLTRVKETYDYMSQKYFTHATPTLYNAGTPHQQLSSCFLQMMESDSIDGIFNTLKECAIISKWAGGIGLHIHNVRASGSFIHGTNGTSNGIVPMLRVFNNTAKYVDQCVHPETIIYTTQGPKQIQQCVMGETEIINLTGKEEVIQNVLEHYYEGETLEIDSIHSIKPLLITPEHPVFALSGEQDGLNPCINYMDVIKNNLDRGICKMEWIDAKDLTKRDMLVHPIPKYEKDIYNISPEDCYMYGIILGEPTEYNIINTMGKKQNVQDFAIQYFEKTCTNFYIYNEKNDFNENVSTKIKWNINLNLPFRYNDFYDENKEKRMQSRWMHLPIEKAKYILKGLIKYQNNELTFDCTSCQLIESVKYLCLRLGVLTTHETKNGIYCLHIPKTKEICELMDIEYPEFQLNFFMRYNDFLLSRIQDIRVITYSGTLYDLQMKTEHNYLLQNGIVHNGGGKRNGSIAIYLEPWHSDVELFLQMRKNHGDEELKARDLFYALWVPDLFMERVKSNDKWTLMCPDECPGLSDVYGDDFVKLYTKYENEGKGRNTIQARDLWFHILDAQMETGTPYILYKDSVNRKSNQKNVGVIKSSNLCTEITEYSSETETAVCNLASIALPAFVDMTTSPPTINYKELHKVAKIIVVNLNNIIDINFYPTEKTRKSNFRHRPIGIGVQGLADVFMMLDIPFTSYEARTINKHIFETIYHASLESSCDLASKYGSYETFQGSPTSSGILQFDLWGIDPTNQRYDWGELKNRIKCEGLRNSLLLAPMPTASTSQILGYNECIEPITSNIYNRRTLAGEFILTNKYLMNDLLKLDLWNEKIKNNIIANNGSISHIEIIPETIREKYKTVWEMSMKSLIDMAADRGAYICQSQSLNLWQEDPNYNSLTSMHFYSWTKGLKTGIYYLRRRAKHSAQQFTIEPEAKIHNGEQEEDEICEACGS